MENVKSSDIHTGNSTRMSLDCSLYVNGDYYGMLFIDLYRHFHTTVIARTVVFTLYGSGSNVSKSEVSVDAETFDDLCHALGNRNVNRILSYLKDNHNVNI